MGKPTGFLEYSREKDADISPLERIKNFNEFHIHLDENERKKQGARCMNCGIPFCQSAMRLNNMVSGCPLHNLIPEWNDEVYNGNWQHALSRLRKTNNFPEFTGRVCPALCEAACTCGLYDDPVTVKENELAIIEKGFKKGYVKPHIPEFRTEKSVAIIGSGPSGLACADQLNQRGHNVTVFEKEDRCGGLLMYGIPNMKLDKSIVERRIEMMKKEGITFKPGTDAGIKSTARKIVNDFDAVVLCCGAGKPRDIDVPGRNAEGVFFAVDFLRRNTKSLLDSNFADGKYVDVKGKNVVIVGGGDTGNDCVGTVIRHGCKSVIQLEMMAKAPDERTADNQWPQWPRICKTDYGQEEAIAVFGHDPRMYRTTVKEIISDDKNRIKSLVIVNLDTNEEQTIAADVLILAAGFLGADEKVVKAFGVKCNDRNNVMTEPENHKTNLESVFTAGDMHRGQSLVVWAICEGREAAKEVDRFLTGYTNMI